MITLTGKKEGQKMYLFDPLAELVSVSASVPDLKQMRKKERKDRKRICWVYD
jgi:hypothetical protein